MVVRNPQKKPSLFLLSEGPRRGLPLALFQPASRLSFSASSAQQCLAEQPALQSS